MENSSEQPGYVTMRVPSAITTLLPVVVLAIAGLSAWVNLGRDVGENTKLIVSNANAQERRWTDHAEYHREKALENASTFARIETRLSAIEAVAPKADQLTYRVGAVETQAAATNKALQDLQQTVNGQAGDIRLILDILRRQDSKSAAAAQNARPR